MEVSRFPQDPNNISWRGLIQPFTVVCLSVVTVKRLRVIRPQLTIQYLFPSQLVLGKNLSKAVTKFHKFTKIHSLACSLGQQQLFPRWHPCQDLWWEVLIKRSLSKHFHGFHGSLLVSIHNTAVVPLPASLPAKNTGVFSSPAAVLGLRISSAYQTVTYTHGFHGSPSVSASKPV